MAKIPIYIAEKGLIGETGRMPISSGLIDNSNAGMKWEAAERFGRDLARAGIGAMDVANRIKEINEQDVRLGMSLRIQDVETKMLDKVTEIEGYSGQEQLNAINDYKTKYRPNIEKAIFDTSSINDNSSYFEKKIKSNGINEQQKGWAQARLSDINQRVDLHIGRLQLSATENVAVQQIQKDTNIVLQGMQKGLINIDDALRSVNSSIDNVSVALRGKSEYYKDNSIQFLMKAYLEQAIENKNMPVINDLVSGKYNADIIGKSGDPKINQNGTFLLQDLLHDAKKAQSANRTTEVLYKYLSEIQSTIDEPGSYRKIADMIEKEKSLSQEEKNLAMNKIESYIDDNRKRRNQERIDGEFREKQAIHRAINSGDSYKALDLISQSKYISEAEKGVLMKNNREDNSPINNTDKVLYNDLETEIMGINALSNKNEVDSLKNKINSYAMKGLGIKSVETLQGALNIRAGTKKEDTDQELINARNVLREARDNYLFLTEDERDKYIDDKEVKKEGFVLNQKRYLDNSGILESERKSGKKTSEIIDSILSPIKKENTKSWIRKIFRWDTPKTIQEPYTQGNVEDEDQSEDQSDDISKGTSEVKTFEEYRKRKGF